MVKKPTALPPPSLCLSAQLTRHSPNDSHINTTGAMRSLGQRCARAPLPEHSPYRAAAVARHRRRGRRRRLPPRPQRSMSPGASLFLSFSALASLDAWNQSCGRVLRPRRKDDRREGFEKSSNLKEKACLAISNQGKKGRPLFFSTSTFSTTKNLQQHPGHRLGLAVLRHRALRTGE